MANNKSKFSKFWDSFILKTSLLKIWFVKNLKTFIMLAVIIYAIAVLTGNASGGLIFGGLSAAIETATSSTTIGDMLMNSLAVILSIGSGVGLVWKKTKNITLDDIKSKKLKMAMVHAGLYFNANGKLVKRAEHILKTDIDGDGKVNNTPVENTEKTSSEFNVVKNTIDAVQELGTILTTKIETQEDYRNLMTPEMQATKDLIDSTNEDAAEKQAKNYEIIKEEISEEATFELKDTSITKKVNKSAIKILIDSIRDLFHKIFKSKSHEEIIEELPESKEEVEENTEIETEFLFPEEYTDIATEVEVVVIGEEDKPKIKTETTKIEQPVVKTTVHSPKTSRENQQRQVSAVERFRSLYNK